jgi:hypothetical protein
MEQDVDESRKAYLDSLDSHISEGMKNSCPKIFDLLQSETALNVFAPKEWPGLKIPPVDLEVSEDMPKRLKPKARAVRDDLLEDAKKEFDRLCKYLFMPSDSEIACAQVVAPKATSPYIRLVGDYRPINPFIKIPQRPIPMPQYEIIKASKYSVFMDLDMANSFHQIPLSKRLSEILSVQTRWGLVRPRFLPEGVGPASGLLQMIVSDIFKDFSDWIVVIFDNFLICANDYEDAYEKLKKILKRCEEYNVILKYSKSWFGMDTVSFFGYEVSHGIWKLSKERKDSISDMTFPTNKKLMQSFLGAALFFRNHIPDYSHWSARLYEMTHDKFVWDPGKWEYDYVSH